MPDIFYSWEHLTCEHYTGGLPTCFKLVRLQKGYTYEFEKGKSDYFLFFLLKGNLDITFNKFFKWGAKAGEMILLSDKYFIKCTSDGEFIILMSDFRGQEATSLFSYLNRYSRCVEYIYRPFEIREPLNLFFQILRTYLNDGLGCLYLHEEKQKELLVLLKIYYTPLELAEFLNPLLVNQEKLFKDLVISYCVRARTVTELISFCGYEPKEFKREFQKVIGQPIYKWMQEQKAMQIKLKLRDPNINIKDLVFEYGFASVSHLNKFCQRWFDMSPTQIRECAEKSYDEKCFLNFE